MTLILAIALAAGAPAAGLRAGASAVDITPAQFPVIVCGGFLEATAGQANDQLFVRSLVLEDGAARIAIAVVDSCVLPRDLLDRAKALARDATGIPAERILISATHTHSAPSAMGCLGSDGDEAYVRFLPGKIAEAIALATKNLAPARAGWIAVDAPDYTHCRRWILRPDRVRTDPFGGRTVRAMMHPGYQNPDFIGPAGPVDSGLSILAVQGIDGRPIAVLANYSMHYFGAAPVSSDYYGLFAAKLQNAIGADTDPPFVAMMSQGTSGDLHWMDYGRPRKEIGIDAYAEALARIALDAYKRIRYRDDATLAMAESRMRLRRRIPDDARLAWAQPIAERMAGRKPANQEEVYAREQILIAAEPETEVVLQAIRIGDLGIAAISCEVFGITGLKIKAWSPLETSFTIELANGEEGYIPPPEQHALGGYTTWPARTAGLDVGAEPKIVEGVLALLERVSGKPCRVVVVEVHGAYADAVLASNPRAYWRMGEFGGLRAADASGKGNDALYGIGIVLYLEGPDGLGHSAGGINRCPHFAGGGAKAVLAGLGPAYTVELWFRNGLPADARDVTGTLFSRPRSDGTAGDRLIIGGIRAARGRLVWTDPRGRSIEGKTDVAAATWHHVAIARDGAHVEIFLDGARAPEIAGEASLADSLGAEILIGTSGDPASSFEGRIDEVAIYDGALPAAEVEAHVAAASADLAALVPAADTVLLARFPSLGAAWDGFRTLPLYRAYRDEEVQEFIRSFLDGMVEKAAPEASASFSPILTLPASFGGEVALALIGPPQDPEWVFSLTSTGEPAAARGSAEKTVVPLLKRISFGEPERKMIEGVEALGFGGPTGTKWLAIVGPRVLIASKEEVLAGLLKRGAAPAGSLAEEATYRRVLARAGGELSFFFFLNLGKIWDETFRNADEDDRKATERSGLSGIRAIGAGLRMANGRATDAIWFDTPDGSKGFLRAVPAVPLEFGTMRLAPRESFAYVAANIRPADFYRTALAVAEAGSGGLLEGFAKADRDLAKGIGLRSLSDVIGLLGTEVGIFAAFPPGGGIFPEAVAAIEVLEPDKLLTNIDALVRTAGGQEPGMLKFRGREIRYLTGGEFIPGAFDSPFSPCWCVTDGWLLISYHPTMIKGAIRRLEGGAESLRDDPAFVAARKGLPERSVAAAFANTERLFRFLYGIVIPIASMVGARLPFNAAELPSADAIAKHLSFGLSGIVVEKDGIAVKTESDGYGPTSLGLYGAIAVLAFSDTLDGRDRFLDNYPCCGGNLRSIHEALTEYRRDHAKHPERLDLLFTAAADRWRLWSARCPAVERERPGDVADWQDFGYLIAERKIDPPASLPDDAMLIWDSEPRHNGGRIVLFAGGAVTWVREAEFRKRLEAQKP